MNNFHDEGYVVMWVQRRFMACPPKATKEAAEEEMAIIAKSNPKAIMSVVHTDDFTAEERKEYLR